MERWKLCVISHFLPWMSSDLLVDWLIMGQRENFEKMRNSYIRYLVLSSSIEPLTNVLLQLV